MMDMMMMRMKKTKDAQERLMHRMAEAHEILESFMDTKGPNHKMMIKLMMKMQDIGADFTEMTGRPPPGPMEIMAEKPHKNVSKHLVYRLYWFNFYYVQT